MGQRQKAREVLGINDIWVLIFGIPVLAFFMPLLFFGKSLSDGMLPYLPVWGVSLLYTSAYWLSTRKIICEMRIRYPEQQQTGKRILATAVLIIVTFAFLSVALDVVHEDILKIPDDGPAKDFDYNVGSFTILLLAWAIYESVFLYGQWKATIIMTEKLKREHVESQLDGLKSQVSPHFLFNSLNTLAYLIPEDSERAVKFVQQLSRVYRYILEIKDEKLINLQQELDFLNSYVFLLKERFGENLRIKIDLPGYLYDTKLVPLSLQILFENSIKHNIISESKPLLIEVFVEGAETLVIKNNLQRKRITVPSTQVGLQNIKNRYAFFTSRKVEVLETTTDFVVKLPLVVTSVPVKEVV